MKAFNIKATLINSDAIKSTTWSVVQQLVVASSTFFILAAIKHATNNEIDTSLTYVCAFVFSLIVVYVPATLSMLYLQQWRISSIESYILSFIEFNYGKASFGHARNKVNAESWLTNECFTVYDQATDLLYQIFSTLMNSSFNILVIALALDPKILVWYTVAGVLLLASNFLFKTKMSQISVAVQTSRKDVGNVMLTAWENIFVGNRHNFKYWFSEFKDQIQASKKTAARFDLVRSLISSGTVVTAILVISIGNGIYFWENRSSMPAIAALIITLPRQLQIVQSIFSFFNLALSWNGVSQQLNELEGVVSRSTTKNEASKYIKMNRIDIFGVRDGARFSSVETLLPYLDSVSSGRLTIRGSNGAGKSTLLMHLKDHLLDNAFYLPSNFADLKFKTILASSSDGNRTISVFKEIVKLDAVKYVILDEWDANLDGDNLKVINDVIEELSATKVVIESRHRT